MTGTVADFLEELKKAPVPDGFGLLFVDRRRRGVDIIQVDGPRFQWGLPIEDMDRCRRLLIISPDIAGQLVDEMQAQPIETMLDWYRFAMWECDEA